MTVFEIRILVFSLLLLGCVATGVIFLLSSLRGYKASNDSSSQLLQQHLTDSLGRQDGRLGQLNEQFVTAIQNMTTNLNERLGQNQQLAQQMQKAMAQRLDSTGKTMGDLKGQLGQLDQATRNILQVGSEVKKLQDILQRPTLRGGLGEWSLENLLKEILPRQHYTMQHRFRNGSIVDALVHLARGHVAIDAKFPLSNFQLMLEEKEESERRKLRRAFLRDVCRRIDEIADKYILPDEGTLDFALMYVPAENVYYEAVINLNDKEPDVCSHGRRRKVIPVSPNTLYGYLMVIATGLKGLQIEKNAQLIRQQLSRFSDDMQLFINDFTMVGKHVNNARAKYEEADRKLNVFHTRLQQIGTEALKETEPPEQTEQSSDDE